MSLTEQANRLSRQSQSGRKEATSAVWVREIAELLASEGLDANALLAAAGIDPADLETSGARIPSEKISRLWEVAAEKNPAIGLAEANVVRPAAFDVVRYAMMSGANLRVAFDRLVAYVGIVGSALAREGREGGGRYRGTCGLHGEVRRQRREFILATVASFCRWVSGRDLSPFEVAIAWPPPADLEPYRQALR